MKYSLRSLMIAVLVLPPLIAVGYAVAVRLMTEPEPLPSSWSGVDDVQYFPPGPEYKKTESVPTSQAHAPNPTTP